MSKNLDKPLQRLISEHADVFQGLLSQEEAIAESAACLVQALGAGGTVYICGNGGSAADSQHFAAELSGRFEMERRGYRAVALTTDTSALTAIANDYGFQQVFARQVVALARKGDVLVVISTSGNSENCSSAVRAAAEMGVTTVGLLGRDGGALRLLCDHAVVVEADSTARIQEAHCFLIHTLCGAIESQV